MKRLEQMRIDARLTPEQLGERAGVAGMTIRRLERGEKARVSTLAKLADALGGDVQPSELLREVVKTEAAA